METGDILGIIGLVFGAGSIVFCVYVTWLFGLEMHIIMALILGLFVLLAVFFFILLSATGTILSIIGIAKTRSKFGIVGLPLSLGSFLWLFIPLLLYLLNPP